MSIEVIIFDLGKVIFDFDISRLSKDFAKYSAKSYLVINDIFVNHLEILAKYEKGQISSDQFYQLMIKSLDLKMSYTQFCDVWNNIFTPFDEVIDFIELLSSKYHLAVLSNTNDLHFEFLKDKYPQVFKRFNTYHLSYQMNTRKPENEIYQKVINFYNIEPGKIFFTDDLDRNIEPAKKLNISAFKFNGVNNLQQDLFSLGVKF